MIAVAAQQLPGVLHSLEPTLRHYGYLAVAGFVLVEDFGLPVPGVWTTLGTRATAAWHP